MAAPAQPGAEVAVVDSPAPISHLTEDLLADILLSLPSLDDIGRAATTWPEFRDVVADPSFKRRLRRARRAPLVGFLFCTFHPAESPHSSAPCARALERAADLSFSYLHSPQPFTRWHPLDARDGRVVLGHAWSASFVVSDPLSRRSLLLPPLPDQALAVALRQHPFLLPAKDDEPDETAFEVGCMVEYEHEPGLVVAVPFVYSSTTGQWSKLLWGATVTDLKPFYACGCFYWKFTPDTLFVLDRRANEFRLVSIPALYGDNDFVIAEAGEGRTGIFTLLHIDSLASASLVCAVMNGEGNAVWWQFKGSITMPPHCIYSFAGASDRHLLLHGSPWHLHGTPPDENYFFNARGCGYFSVESDTLKMEKVCDLEPLVAAVPYTSFPPSLCLTTI
ncbi:unnamed protein product [Urochloa decumbens]|uniref:F-box domain-containing protein n=1 Tax=Urochloa decumbens TaxID=240449 RepID=A0ABC9FWG2_9POAL